jgi:cytochrome b
MIRVWSPLVRICHWTLVAAFAVVWLTGDDLMQAHAWAGYVAAGAVLVRLVWGLVGPEADRLSHLLRPPGEVLRYLADAVRLRSPRSVGHSPAGAVMALAVLLSMAVTTGTGMVTLAQTRDAGPLAPWLGKAAGQAGLSLIAPARADDDDGDERDGGATEAGAEGGGVAGEIHQFFAYLTLLLVALHVSGVALASLSHRENLVRSMVTGDKRANAG